MLKTVLYLALLLVFVAAGVAVGVWEYGSTVSRKGLSELTITSTPSGRPTTVSVNGGIISSGAAVSSVRQHREGHCIVIVVRQGFILHGRTSGYFHIDVALPNDVDEIAFGDSHDVIWHRERVAAANKVNCCNQAWLLKNSFS